MLLEDKTSQTPTLITLTISETNCILKTGICTLGGSSSTKGTTRSARLSKADLVKNARKYFPVIHTHELFKSGTN